MATYIPNATQTTEPVESRTVESAALEFRTLKTSINARIEGVQDNLDAEVVSRIAGDASLQTQNNAQDVRLSAIENALLSIGEGGLPGTVHVQRFSGTGVQTAFTLNTTPQSGNVVDIYINGIYQNKDTFSVAGAVITFSEAPPAGTDNIEVVSFAVTLAEDAQLRAWLGDPAAIPGRLDELEQFNNDVADPEKGAALVGWSRKPVVEAVRSVGQMLSAQSLSLWEFASAVTSKPNPDDPETWDWAPAFDACMAAAEQTGMSVSLPPLKMKTSKAINVPDGITVVGCGGGGYVTEIVDPAAWRTVITKTNGNVDGDCVISLGKSAQLWNVQVRPEDTSYAVWDNGEYIIGSGNVNNGVRLGQASRTNGVTAVGFPDAGFEVGMLTKCTDCYAFMCSYGYKSRADEGDASIVECIGMFCYQAGADLRGGYWKVIGGRWEWNARYGIIGSASFICVGAAFDRNGWSGIWLPEGYEGATITGNHFRRNGAGGDGAFGRTGWMTPEHPGYVFTSNENSSHIRIDNKIRTQITGNSFSPGKDDAGGGADAPRHVYTSGLPSGSTKVDGIVISGNQGDRDEEWPGYAPTYNGGGASTWGGTDNTLTWAMDRTGTVIPIAVHSEVFSGLAPETQTAVVGVEILLPKGSSGRVQIQMKQAFSGEYSEVFYATDATGGHYYSVNNVIGVNVSSVSMDTLPDHERMVVSFVASCFAKYSVFTA